MVQWSCFLGSLLLAATVAGQLGADRRAAVLATVLCATIPMGIIEASTAKNDFVAGFWLLCFVHFLMQVKQADNGRRLADALLAGGALGLALLTKATCYLFALPFLLWLISALRSMRAWKALVLVAGVALFQNAGHYRRNFQVYGHAFGADREDGHSYANETVTLPLLISNLVRNASLHLDTRVPHLNRLAACAVLRAHDLLGVDPSDPRSTWQGATFRGPREATDSDTAGNLWHFLLIIAAFGLVLCSPSLVRLRAYACAIAGGFLLFCAFLRWQPWHSRLHLPLFVLACPFVAVALCARLGRKTTAGFAVLLVAWALPPALRNEARPLLGSQSVLWTARESQYFRNWADLELPYRRGARVLRAAGCSRIGLYKNVVWEYPLWALLRAQDGRVRIEHVGVENASAPLAKRERFASFSPCAIVSFQPSAQTTLGLGSSMYERKWSSGRISVFFESPAGGSAGSRASPKPGSR